MPLLDDVSESLFLIDFVKCWWMIRIFIYISRLVIVCKVWFINVVLQIKCDVWKNNSFQTTFYGDGKSTMFEGLFSFFLSLVLEFCKKIQDRHPDINLSSFCLLVILVGWE